MQKIRHQFFVLVLGFARTAWPLWPFTLLPYVEYFFKQIQCENQTRIQTPPLPPPAPHVARIMSNTLAGMQSTGSAFHADVEASAAAFNHRQGQQCHASVCTLLRLVPYKSTQTRQIE